MPLIRTNPWLVGAMVLVVFVLATQSTQAACYILTDTACWGVRLIGTVGQFVVSLLAYLLTVAQWFLEIAINQNFDYRDKLPGIIIGWQISRDLTNLFFIIVLLIISISTVLRVGGYYAKQLVPRLVIIALLINFSLSIGLVVVDVSNVIGAQFFNTITEDGSKAVSEVILEKTGIQSVFNASKNIQDASGSDLSSAQVYAITAWGNAIFLAVLVFVFFVGAIMLLFRIVALAIILMLSPLAFLFYILPDTQAEFGKWWKQLINNAFYLPAFLFMIYFAIAFVSAVGFTNKAVNGNFFESLNNPPASGSIGTPLIFNYLILILLLLQAITLGKKMGAAGADTALKWAYAGKKWATGVAGRIAAAPISLSSQMAQRSRTVQALQDRLAQSGAGRLLGRGLEGMLQRGATLGSGQARAEKNADFVLNRSPGTWLNAFRTMTPAEREAFLRKMPKAQLKDFMDKLSPQEQALAKRYTGTRAGAPAEADLESSAMQREVDFDKRRNLFGNASRLGKETYLRSLNPQQQREFIAGLRANGMGATADDAERIISQELSAAQRTAYDVTGLNALSAEEQFAAFEAASTSNAARAAFLLAKKPEERKAFIDKLTDPDAARRIMENYFTPEQLEEQGAADFKGTQNVAARKAIWGAANNRVRQRILKDMDDKQQALWINGLGTNEQIAAEILMDSFMTSAQRSKYQASAFELQPFETQRDELANLSDETIEEISRRKKDAGAMADFHGKLNTAGKDAMDRVAKSSFAPNLNAEYEAAKLSLITDMTQMATEFEKSSTLVQEQLLRRLKGEKRAAFLRALNTTQATIAEKVIDSRFSPEEKGGVEAETYLAEADKDKKMDLFAKASKLGQEQIINGFKEDDDRERFLVSMEKSGNASYEQEAMRARQFMGSDLFTASRRNDFLKAYRKNLIQVAGGRLSEEFYDDPTLNAKERAARLELMDNKEMLTLLEDSKGDPARMESLSSALNTMKPNLRKQFLSQVLSRASSEAISQYWDQKDLEYGNAAGNPQIQQTISDEKRQAFKELSSEAQAKLYVRALDQNATHGNHAPLDEFEEFTRNSTDAERKAYQEKFVRVIGDERVKDPQKARDIYDSLDPAIKNTVLQTKGGDKVVLALQDQIIASMEASGQDTELTVKGFEADFNNAGIRGNYKKPETWEKRGEQWKAAETKEAASRMERQAPNQEAYRQAREASGGSKDRGGERVFAKSVQDWQAGKRQIVDIPLTEAAEFFEASPSHLKELRNAADPQTSAFIKNTLEKSVLYKRYKRGPELNAFSPEEQQTIFEAVAGKGEQSNPLELSRLRKTITESPNQKEIIETVVAQSSKDAYQTYVKQINASISTATSPEEAARFNEELQLAERARFVAAGPTDAEAPDIITRLEDEFTKAGDKKPDLEKLAKDIETALIGWNNTLNKTTDDAQRTQIQEIITKLESLEAQITEKLNPSTP